MKNIETKLTLLLKIAHELNAKNVLWALGGSMLLYMKKVVTNFNDIDMMVAESDVNVTESILSKFGHKTSHKANPQYKTKTFLRFETKDTTIDVIAGFTIVKDKKLFYLPLTAGDIDEYVEINGEKIPLQSLSDWRRFYELMERKEKVDLIDKFQDINI